MKTLIMAALLALFSITTLAAEKAEPWYLKDSKPTTLKAAFAADVEYLGKENRGFAMNCSPNLRKTFDAVDLPCSYNARGTLSYFLTVNGKGLFPASGGTNQYVTREGGTLMIVKPLALDDVFIGTVKQNEMLRQAVARNAKLFRNGDLSVDDVKKSWR